MVAREPKAKLNPTLIDIMTTISREEVRVKYLTEIFGSDFKTNPDYHDIFRIVDVNLTRQLDRVIDFYYEKYVFRKPRTFSYSHPEMSAKLNNAALEAERRGKFKNARDLFILAGYACHTRREPISWNIQSNLRGLLKYMPEDQKPKELPNWYEL